MSLERIRRLNLILANVTLLNRFVLFSRGLGLIRVTMSDFHVFLHFLVTFAIKFAFIANEKRQLMQFSAMRGEITLMNSSEIAVVLRTIKSFHSNGFQSVRLQFDFLGQFDSVLTQKANEGGFSARKTIRIAVFEISTTSDLIEALCAFVNPL